MPEIEDRRLVRHPLHRQINPGKTPHRLAVVQRFLHRLVSQRVPLLQKVNPQHPLQRHRRTTALALRIKRLYPRHQPRPQPAPAKTGGTTCSISARNLSRRVCFFLLAYSACEKLPCCCMACPSSAPDSHFYPTSPPNPPYFSVSLGLIARYSGSLWAPAK